MEKTGRNSRRWLIAGLLLASVSVALVAGGAVWGQAPAATEAASHAKALSKAFRGAAEEVMPTVVKIKTHTKVQPVGRRGQPNGQPHGQNPFEGTPFEDLFRGGDMGGQFRQFMPPRDGVGSGVVIDKSGIILTNNHVVAGADEVTVELFDGREFKATEVKTDPQTDLAVVRISGAGDLPAARLGNSDALEIGDWVIAIGNPFELDTTVSAGIISGKQRELEKVQRGNFLQTDAAINPGNSGGPLVDLAGEVVGINTAIASNSGGYQGIGFAIPINTARWVTDQLIQKGVVDRAYLGIKIGEIDNDLAKQFGATSGGALVNEVLPNTPAAAAGLREGDVIVGFAGQTVKGPRSLQDVVERSPLDKKQPLKILRDGKPETLSVAVAAMPREYGVVETSRPATQPKDDGYTNDKLGLHVTEFSADVAKQLGYDTKLSGVVISGIEPGSVADTKGLSEGMLIRRVGSKNVSNVKEFEEAMKTSSLDDGILLLVRMPSGAQTFLVLKATS